MSSSVPRVIALLSALTLCLSAPSQAQSDSAKTGEFDLVLTERSPQSAPKELARRFNIPEKEISPDYDLAKCPFKIYVPTNYNPTTPLGIFVYLSYKNSEITPLGWGPALDELHMIFVTPVCHSGQQYAPSVPLWQANGLAMDVVHYLKHQYKIQEDRVYLMTWDHPLQSCLGMADVFTGFAPVGVGDFYKKLKGSNGGFYPPKLAQPPAPLLQLAQSRGFFLIYGSQPDNSDSLGIVSSALPREGFRHTTIAVLSMSDDVHAPNLKIDWFRDKAIPFLDSAVAAEAKTSRPIITASSKPAQATSAPGAAATISTAQHQLDMAQLYLSNGQRDIAKSKLQQIIRDYPADPASQKAKQILESLDKP